MGAADGPSGVLWLTAGVALVPHQLLLLLACLADPYSLLLLHTPSTPRDLLLHTQHTLLHRS